MQAYVRHIRPHDPASEPGGAYGRGWIGSYSSRLNATFRKVKSNLALCATKTHPRANSAKPGSTHSMGGAAATIASWMPVRRDI